MANGKCFCGAPECWDEDDYSWLASRSGITMQSDDGIHTDIFFIHGKQIRHQVHFANRKYGVDEFIGVLRRAADGLSQVALYFNDGEDGLSVWLDGIREPTPEDMARLEAARRKQIESDEKEIRRLSAEIQTIKKTAEAGGD